MKIEMMKVSDLVPYENNPRDNDSAVDAVANSIKEFGFLVPVLIDKERNIVAGHTRFKAAQKLGIEKVPTITLGNLSDEDIRKYRIVDNKTGELSSWDYELLKEELGSIDEINMAAFNFDFENPAKENQQDIEITSNLDEGSELDLDDFSDEVFANECPYCGFRWNE